MLEFLLYLILSGEWAAAGMVLGGILFSVSVSVVGYLSSLCFKKQLRTAVGN